jgi:hypothetical protein
MLDGSLWRRAACLRNVWKGTQGFKSRLGFWCSADFCKVGYRHFDTVSLRSAGAYSPCFLLTTNFWQNSRDEGRRLWLVLLLSLITEVIQRRAIFRQRKTSWRSHPRLWDSKKWNLHYDQTQVDFSLVFLSRPFVADIYSERRNSDHHHVREAFEKSLKELDCEYIDLYLMHWPQATISGS